MEKKNTIAKIMDMVPLERPREKLLCKGPCALSNQELLTILLGSGSAMFPVNILADQLFDNAGQNLIQLSKMTPEELCVIKGIGESKATILLAAFELGKRTFEKRSVTTDVAKVKEDIKNIFSVSAYLQYILILMNEKKEVLATCEMRPTLNLLPDISAIIKISLEAGADEISLAFNDRIATDRFLLNDQMIIFMKLKAAAGMLNIVLKDVISVSDTACTVIEV